MHAGLVIKLVVAAAVVVAAACLYVFTPLHDVSSVEDIQRLVAPVVASPWLPLIMLAAFLVAGLLLLSVWLVILQTCVLYPPLVAFPLALGGALLSALVFYGLGRLLGRDVVVKLAPAKVQQALASVSLESIVAVRLLPLLPFTFVNLCCGAFDVPLRTYLLGTVLGMSPGILGIAVLGAQVVEAVKHPTPGAVVGLIVVVVALVGGAVLLRRRANRRAA